MMCYWVEEVGTGRAGGQEACGVVGGGGGVWRDSGLCP